MFRSVRNKKNEISTDAAKELLRTGRRGVLAVNGDDGYPYAVPVNYLYDEASEKILFHGAKKGYKVDALKLCDKVCFTVISNETIKDEPWAPYLSSAVVFGKCHLIEDQEECKKLAKKISMKFYPNEAMVDEVIAKSGAAVQIFEISIEHISGKQIQEK